MRGEDGALSQIVAAVGEGVEASDKNFLGPSLLMFGAPTVWHTNNAARDLSTFFKKTFLNSSFFDEYTVYMIYRIYNIPYI